MRLDYDFDLIFRYARFSVYPVRIFCSGMSQGIFGFCLGFTSSYFIASFTLLGSIVWRDPRFLLLFNFVRASLLHFHSFSLVHLVRVVGIASEKGSFWCGKFSSSPNTFFLGHKV